MLIRCPQCGFARELDASQVPDSAVMATCPECRHRFRFRAKRMDAADDPLPPGAITPAGDQGASADHPFRPDPQIQAGSGTEERHSLFTGGSSDLAWETAPLSRMPVALYQTILQVLFAAPAFFTRVGASAAPLSRPAVFYVLIGTLQSVVQHFWLLARLNELASLQDPKIQATLDTLTQNLSLPMVLISMPPMLLILLLFYAGLFNLMIRLVQPDRANFSTTLRVVAYSAAPGVLCVVPVVGTYAASIWFAFCCFVGCKYALRLEWKRTAMALLPLYALSVAFSMHVNTVLMGLAQ